MAASGVLSAVVWGGDDALLASHLAGFCNGTVSLAALGSQLTAAELAQSLQQMLSSGQLNAVINGVVFVPVNTTVTHSVLSSTGASGGGGGGSSGMLFAAAGAGGALLLILIVVIVLVRRKRRTMNKTHSGSVLTRHDSRLSGKGAKNSMAFVNPMYTNNADEEGPQRSASITQNPLFEGDETFYHESSGKLFNAGADNGYLDMCPEPVVGEPVQKEEDFEDVRLASFAVVTVPVGVAVPQNYEEASEVPVYGEVDEEPVYGEADDPAAVEPVYGLANDTAGAGAGGAVAFGNPLYDATGTIQESDLCAPE